jgi:tRNA A-37 threonylcarbamoyl transferase component Bud32
MNALVHDSQIVIKSSARRTESFFDTKPRLTQNPGRVRVFSYNISKRVQSNHLKGTDLNLTKETPSNIKKSSLNVTYKDSRPLTANNSNKQRLTTAKSNQKYKLTLNLPEEQKQKFFGPMVKKLYTPLNFKGSLLSSKFIAEPLSERQNGVINNYLIGKDIGKGAYAIVKYAIHKPTNRKVAIKIYDKTKFVDPNRLKNAKREIQILQKLNHSNVLKLYEAIETEEFMYLVLEFINGCSLQDYVKKKVDRRLDEQEACRLFMQLIQALDYCHSNDVAHRDIKFENILLDHLNNLKLIDFGFSTNFPADQKIKIFCGTPSYMAPEIVNRQEYSGPPVDIWASGVVLFGLLCGYFPFKSQTDKECYKKIQSGIVLVPNFVSDHARSLIESILEIDPLKRLNAKQILASPWFKILSNTEANQSLTIEFNTSADEVIFSQLVTFI